jgi:iron complex transport system substrate-binding protein
MPGDMIKRAGGISIFDDIEKGWATPSWEEVVARDPDVILILDYDYDTDAKIEFLQNNDFTKNLRAVKEGRIYSACCADMQGSAGSAGTVEIMAKQFYPDKF